MADGVRLFRTEHGHVHVEAFCLMWYACSCGHRERIWNSRDGVTPFGMACPSCDQPEMKHVDWKLDSYAPNFKPASGQRVWVSMTRERAAEIAAIRIELGNRSLTTEDREIVIESLFNGGQAPDVKVWGYDQAKDCHG